MSAVSFRSVFMVASCAGAALGCYLVSLRVASERAALEDVETKIVLAQRDIRVLQTEIGTRGRLAQLERWNVKVMALSAPTADQFLKGGFELARFTAPEQKPAIETPVVLASAPTPDTRSAATPAPTSSGPLLHEASLKTASRDKPQVSLERGGSRHPAGAIIQPGSPPKKTTPKLTPNAADRKTGPQSTLVSAKAKAPPTALAKPPMKTKVPAEVKRAGADTKASPAKSSIRDPLAPLPGSRAKMASALKSVGKQSRESTSKR